MIHTHTHTHTHDVCVRDTHTHDVCVRVWKRDLAFRRLFLGPALDLRVLCATCVHACTCMSHIRHADEDAGNKFRGLGVWVWVEVSGCKVQALGFGTQGM